MPTYAQNYLAALHSYQQEMLQRVAELVNIDSGTGQIEGVNRIAKRLVEWLDEIGFSVELHEAPRFGNNVVAKRRGRAENGRPRLLIVGHIDTVYEAGSAASHPFCEEGELAYGPGVIDMKSGVVMGIYALRALLEAGFEQFGEICVVFNNDEEVGSPGSSSLLADLGRQADIGLVLEPTRAAEIVTNARKGADRYVLEISGIPAHSGAEPFKGRSAVLELAHKILAVHALHSLFPGTTFNITRLTSSETLNIVPDYARCTISVRAHSDEMLNAAAAALEQIATSVSVPDTRATLKRTRGRIPYRATPEITRLVGVATEEAQALGIALVAESKGGVSDANLLMSIGLPTLDSLGPVGGSMHDLNREYLRPASLVQRGAMLAGVIQHLCLLESTGE